MSDTAIYEDLIQHERWLTRLAQRLVGGEDACELVQETFVRAIATPPADLTHPRAWLETVLRNLAASLHRRRVPEALDALEAAETLATNANQPEHAIERFEAGRAVSDAILGLPEREKHVILMYWQEELRIVDISRSLGQTESAVRKRLASAHRRLRHRLSDDYGEGRWMMILAPLVGEGAARPAPTAAGMSSAALVSVIAVACACAVAIGFGLAGRGAGPRPDLALAGTGLSPPGPGAADELAPRVLDASDPASVDVRAPQSAADADGDATPPAPASAADGTDGSLETPEIAFARVKGDLLLDGVPITNWAARLRQLEDCVENCTVRATMTDASFELETPGGGYHKLVLDSEVVDGVFNTLHSTFSLSPGESRVVHFTQATTGLTVTGVQEGYADLFAYWTDGAGLEYMQRALVVNGTARFPAAPVGPIDLRVPRGGIMEPSAWPVVGRVHLSADQDTSIALQR